MFEKLIKSQLMLRRHREHPLAKERESYLEDRWNKGASLSKLTCEARNLLDAVKILKMTDCDCMRIPVEKIIWCTQVWSSTVSVKHPDASAPKTGDAVFERVLSQWLAYIGRIDERCINSSLIFNVLFDCGWYVRRYIAAPFYVERKAHLEHLLSEGYKPNVIRRYARFHLALIDCLHLSELRYISSVDLEAAVKEWDKKKIPSHGKKSNHIESHNDFLFIGKSWFSYIGFYTEVTQMPVGYEYALKYLRWIMTDKGYSPYTEKTRKHHLESFLRYLEKNNTLLADVTLLVIDKYVMSKKDSGYARATMAGIVATLKNFFLYAEQQHWCKPGLRDSIMVARQYKEETLPSFVGWDVVRRMIGMQDSNRGTGIRNRATMLLMSIYGLRCCEVAELKLSDIDWKREEIHIRRAKGGKFQVLPFVKEVGDAIIDYIRLVRNNESESEYVFLRTRAPYTGIAAASLYAGVTASLRAQGITLQHYGPHTLRHSCATHLVNNGHSLKEVADLLGHQKLDTTRLYAKVDITALRKVAEMDWEGCL